MPHRTDISAGFSGDRTGVPRCPFGVRRRIARHDRDLPPEEVRAGMAAEA
ncbi:hypothetical protein [Actinophytocola sp.]